MTHEAFVAACQRELGRIAGLAAEELEAAQTRLRALGRELVELDRRILATTRRTTLFQEVAQRDAMLAREYQQLRELPEIRELGVDGSIVWLLTEPLSLEHGGRRHRLGSYRLELDLAGELRVLNTANPGARPMWDHPHVQGGLPCLGNVREGVLKLIAELELALAARVLLDFLHTYNPETAYGPIDLWPSERTEPASHEQ